jgi:hypothetical protein
MAHRGRGERPEITERESRPVGAKVRRSGSVVFVAIRKCLLLYFHWVGAIFEYGVVAISRHSDQGFFFAPLAVGQE